MKKTLLAAALLAGFAGAAHAQSTSVTLYGLIDTGLTYTKQKFASPDLGADFTAANPRPTRGNSFSRIGGASGVQSGSRWGLRGSEDLGDGLRAIFTVESGFDTYTGRSGQGGRLFGRTASVGLAGDTWGTLEFGRQLNMASRYLGDLDPFGRGFGQANIGHGISAANTVWYDNMVLYRTPNFNGFQAGIGYSFAEEGNAAEYQTSDNARALTLALRYANGPLNVAVAYDQLKQRNRDTDEGINIWTGQSYKNQVYVENPRTGFPSNNGPFLGNDAAGNPVYQGYVNTDTTIRSFGIGAAYDFEVVRLSAVYARTTNGWFNGQGLIGGNLMNGAPARAFRDGFRANSYMLGVSAPIGSGNIMASWQLADPKNDKLTGDDEKMNTVSVAYTYDLSRRTNLYSIASYSKDYGFVDGNKSTVLGFGLRHMF